MTVLIFSAFKMPLFVLVFLYFHSTAFILFAGSFLTVVLTLEQRTFFMISLPCTSWGFIGTTVPWSSLFSSVFSRLSALG